ncbi:MAG: SGNH/GDSL hydrolase family protein [Planctomycetota bacterium]
MIDRRAFLKGGTASAGAAVISSLSSVDVAKAADAPRDFQTRDSRNSGYSYRLPNLEKGTRLVFIGDSITDMKWGRNEKDRNHYLGHSYVYLIAARLGVDMPQAELEFFNRGHSGNRLADLKSRWQRDVIEMKPDLLSVLVGVNDRRVKKGQTVDFVRWENDYRAVLNRSRQANGKLKIVLIDPFVLKTGRWVDKDDEWDRNRLQIASMREIVSKLAKEFEAVQIPMQAVYDEAAKHAGPEQWIWDGVHPLPQGHELIARTWLDRVSARWA